MSNGKSVLIIDDEDIVRYSCTRILVPKGFSVDVANDAIDGMRMMNEKTYDLVLTDLKMPHMNGFEFFLQLKKSHPDIRIIMVTGYSTADTAERARRHGIKHYLEKPFTPESLLEIVEKALAD